MFFYFLLRFTVIATAAAATHKTAAAEPIAAYFPEVLGIFPAFTVLPSDETVPSVAAGIKAASDKSTEALTADIYREVGFAGRSVVHLKGYGGNLAAERRGVFPNGVYFNLACRA